MKLSNTVLVCSLGVVLCGIGVHCNPEDELKYVSKSLPAISTVDPVPNERASVRSQNFGGQLWTQDKSQSAPNLSEGFPSLLQRKSRRSSGSSSPLQGSASLSSGGQLSPPNISEGGQLSPPNISEGLSPLSQRKSRQSSAKVTFAEPAEMPDVDAVGADSMPNVDAVGVGKMDLFNILRPEPARDIPDDGELFKPIKPRKNVVVKYKDYEIVDESEDGVDIVKVISGDRTTNIWDEKSQDVTEAITKVVKKDGILKDGKTLGMVVGLTHADGVLFFPREGRTLKRRQHLVTNKGKKYEFTVINELRVLTNLPKYNASTPHEPIVQRAEFLYFCYNSICGRIAQISLYNLPGELQQPQQQPQRERLLYVASLSALECELRQRKLTKVARTSKVINRDEFKVFNRRSNFIGFVQDPIHSAEGSKRIDACFK